MIWKIYEYILNEYNLSCCIKDIMHISWLVIYITVCSIVFALVICQVGNCVFDTFSMVYVFQYSGSTMNLIYFLFILFYFKCYRYKWLLKSKLYVIDTLVFSFCMGIRPNPVELNFRWLNICFWLHEVQWYLVS